MVKKNFPEKALHPGNPLKTVFAVGLVLALVISWSLVYFLLMRGRDPSGKGNPRDSTFARELGDYDSFAVPKRVLDGENPQIGRAHV